MASKKAKSLITSSVTSPVTSLMARQFREKLTRVTSPVVAGKPTQAAQANRWTP
jgi:hypothetical protein